MYRTLANTKLLRCLPHGGIVVYDVVGNGYCTFFDIFLHGFPPENVFYILLKQYMFYAEYLFKIP